MPDDCSFDPCNNRIVPNNGEPACTPPQQAHRHPEQEISFNGFDHQSPGHTQLSQDTYHQQSPGHTQLSQDTHHQQKRAPGGTGSTGMTPAKKKGSNATAKHHGTAANDPPKSSTSESAGGAVYKSLQRTL
jgi:hypothetical protein